MRGRVAGEIVGGGHHDYLHILADTHRNHVFLHLFPQPDPRIKLLLDYVGQAVVDIDFYLNVRVLLEQRRYARPQVGVCRMLGGSDTDQACGFVLELIERRDLILYPLKMRLQAFKQPLARRGRGDAARGPGQQPNAQSLLQPPHGVAQGGLGYPQVSRRAGKAAFSCHRHEGDQVVVVGFCHELPCRRCDRGRCVPAG
ncbi:hypothetical protein D3C71_1415280 [compost metagenome]